MATKPEDPITPFFHMVGMALSGDPVMLRALAATVAAFSVRVLVAVLILVVTLWFARKLAALAERAIDRLPHHGHPADRTLALFVSTLVKYVVIAMGVIAVLQQLGVQATSVLAVLGAASLAVGLALQGTLGNVAAGVMILLLRPYRTGDRVEINGKQGRVLGMDLFNTRLEAYDGLTLYLPNGKVFGDMIINISQSGHHRLELTFGVDHEDDLDLALATLIDVAKADRRVLATPPPWAKVTAIADSSIQVMLRCWTDPEAWIDTGPDLIKQVKEAFEARGLTFPYPHQVAVDRADVRPAAKARKAAASPEAAPRAGSR